MPLSEEETLPDAPVQINWNKVSTLQEGVKVFIGGIVKAENSRLNFAAAKEIPLTVIFYNCEEEKLTEELILSSRTRNEYWNTFTPISLGIGIISLIYIAASLLGRPAYRMNVIAALVAIFVPALPVIPPGLLFSAVSRRLSLRARQLRAYRDLALITNPSSISHSHSIKAYALEILAWIILIAGIIVNVFFIFLILSLLE